jgi:hypothetical protein
LGILKMLLSISLVLFILLCRLKASCSKLSKIQSDCELEALNIGTRLADRFNSFDEKTEQDVKLHHDYLTKYMGFAGWIQGGTWKNTALTALKNNAPEVYRSGGWGGSSSKSVADSSYWPLEDKWVYMMGDSTMRQVWATMLSPLQSNEFERNAKEWTRENCAKQFPHRKQHPADHYFPDEEWGGRCGNNEVTCHMSGYGKEGKITFDWKHFPWEDYDEWLFGADGLWKLNSTAKSFPDYLVVHVGLHTCVHSWTPQSTNYNMIKRHEKEIALMVDKITDAINRTPNHLTKTTVIFQLPGRGGGSNPRQDHCSREFNRILAKEAHRGGYTVIEREELERRMLFKSEFLGDFRVLKPNLHLESPAPNIIATSLLGLIGCLIRNGTAGTELQAKYALPY